MFTVTFIYEYFFQTTKKIKKRAISESEEDKPLSSHKVPKAKKTKKGICIVNKIK